MTFDQEMLDAEIGQENRAGKAAASAADNQNRRVDGDGHNDSSHSGLSGVHSLVWFVTQLQPVVLQITTS
jgi:hypothetical protein